VSDNIPGVEGIGKKTAAEIIQKYGNIKIFMRACDRYGCFKTESKRNVEAKQKNPH